jgi:hypothetical protein
VRSPAPSLHSLTCWYTETHPSRRAERESTHTESEENTRERPRAETRRKSSDSDPAAFRPTKQTPTGRTAHAQTYTDTRKRTRKQKNRAQKSRAELQDRVKHCSHTHTPYRKDGDGLLSAGRAASRRVLARTRLCKRMQAHVNARVSKKRSRELCE